MEKKRNDLKKLALMGLTGGLFLSASGQIAANEAESGETQTQFFTNNSAKYGSYLAGGSCGSSGHGCSAPPSFNTENTLSSNASQANPNGSMMNQVNPNGSMMNQANPNGSMMNQANPNGTMMNQANPNGSMMNQANPNGSMTNRLSQGSGCGHINTPRYTQNQGQGGCGAPSPRNNGYYSQNQRQGGCGVQQAPRNNNAYYSQNQRQGGCGAQQAPRNNNAYYSQNQRQGGCGAQQSPQRYADSMNPGSNNPQRDGMMPNHSGQHMNRPLTPRGGGSYADNESRWEDDYNKSSGQGSNQMSPQSVDKSLPPRAGGYVAESDPMGDGTQRMEQQANKMNPQSPKIVPNTK